MRARLIVVGALLALAGAPPAQAGRCPRHLPRGPALPSPVEVVTRCGVFAIGADGAVRWSRRHSEVPAWAPAAVSHPDPRTWVAHPEGRLAVYRDGGLFWRSHVRRVSDDVAVRGDLIAFTVYRGGHTVVWVGRRHGREHPAGLGEVLVGWTRGGLVTRRGSRLLLRTPDGQLVRMIARAHTAYRDGDSILLLTTDARIVRTDGVEERRVADLRKLGLAKQPWMVRLRNGLIQVQSRNRVVFLRPDGSRFASAAFASQRGRTPGGSIIGDVLPLPRSSGVAFVVVRPRPGNRPGRDTVYVLERGHRVPRPLFSARRTRQTCGEWATVEYRAGRILYTTNQGALAVLDPAGRRPPLDLTRLAARLSPQRPTPDDFLSAYWI